MKLSLLSLTLLFVAGLSQNAAADNIPFYPGAAAPDAPAADPAALRRQIDARLFDAARLGEREVLATFIEARYDLNTRTPEGFTPLILAAYNGQHAAVVQLLAAGADACAKDRRGNTAMMGAIFKGELGIARLLLGTPCNPDERNDAGQTPAMYAALFGRLDILKELAARGADLHAADAVGNTPEALVRGEIRTH